MSACDHMPTAEVVGTVLIVALICALIAFTLWVADR